LCFDDYVGLAKLPALDELRLRRKISGIAFDSALIDPRLNAGDLLAGETQIVGKVQLAGFGKPRRHDAALRDGSDLAGVSFGVGISEQREGGSFAGPVARSTGVKQDGSDVTREGNPLMRRCGWSSRLARAR
jgi:hypothetical protein